MKEDLSAVGGFFEDLPVLAFVLAGVMSVAGTSCWTSGQLSEDCEAEQLERSASLLVALLVDGLRDLDGMTSVGTALSANLSAPLSSIAYRLEYVVSIWCIHPVLELLRVVGSFEYVPLRAYSESVHVNVLCENGIVGILEVAVLVWEA